MTPAEYEVLLHDAEVKLARLKALYEQYFQGIEKLEPQVARKDLDRAMEVLRKNQPRNTALRFRTQMLMAKYGTYQTYWQRIARQIEEGTFRRDVVRAQQRRQRDRARPPERAAEGEGPSAWELDVDVELDEPVPSLAAAPSAASSGVASVSPSRAVSFDDSDVDAILGSLGPRPSEPSPARRVLSPFAMGRTPGATTAPTRPSPAAGLAAAGAPSPGAPAAGAPAPPKPVTTFGKPGTATFPRAPQPAVGAPAAVVPPRSPAAVTPPRPPVAAAAPPPRPPAPPPPRPPARPDAPPVAARPVPTTAPDDARLRTIYESYVEARRRNNERVDNVKFETVAHSVQQLIPKLREKHGNRPIDFEVVVQNGKVGLKPKVGG